MEFNYNDGGRAKAGYKGVTGDCGVRAMAIVTGKTYQEIYDMVNDLVKSGKGFKQRKTGKVSDARTGVWQKDVNKIMLSLGWKWTPTMLIGQGCKVHLKADELPSGRILCNVSRHYTAVIDGVVNDIYDCSRDDKRCVYGYYSLVGEPTVEAPKVESVEEVKPEIETPVVRVKPNREAEKISKLLSSKKAWETKFRRAENKLKKLNKAIKYYQNKKSK
jgi:hypothetical protein